MSVIKRLLVDIFNHDFSGCTAADFHARFFARVLTIGDLRKVCALVCASHLTLADKTIPSAIFIQGKKEAPPFAILAQLHGNEPAGLAGILLAMALADAGLLEQDCIGMIGNPIAAAQYFVAWAAAPGARQETRDAYRGGVHEDGSLMGDMNRIPVDFMSRAPSDHHTKRAQELFTVAQHIGGILDIHSARGNMVCITDHKRDQDLKHSPIRAVLTELAEAISANASTAVTVQTFKTIAGVLPNLISQTGIEAGRHEAPDAPYNAASFTLSLLGTLGVTRVGPLYAKENGVFERYSVRPRITYADLMHTSTLRAEDQIYMAKACRAAPKGCDTVIVKQADGDYRVQRLVEFQKNPAGAIEYALYQYDEMEAIAANQVVAVAVPSGTAFSTLSGFSGIFVSKPAALYDRDPAVGPWPVAAGKIGGVKFCYPCDVSDWKIAF